MLIWHCVAGSGCLLACSAGKSHVDNLSKFIGWNQGVVTGLHLLGFWGKWSASKRRAPTTRVNVKSINWHNDFHSLNFFSVLLLQIRPFRDWQSRVLHPAHLLQFLALVVPFLYSLLWDVWLIGYMFCVKAHSEISCRAIISQSDTDLGNDIKEISQPQMASALKVAHY